MTEAKSPPNVRFSCAKMNVDRTKKNEKYRSNTTQQPGKMFCTFLVCFMFRIFPQGNKSKM